MFAMTYKDQLNRKLQLKEIPKRIISLVPSQTELLVDLGIESSIVGVTKFCVHPYRLRKDKVVVGGTKQINIDKIKALKPDIILCNKEENTKAIIEGLINVAPIHVSDIYNIEDSYELIKMYGKLFNVESKASSLISGIQTERETFQKKIKNIEKPRVAYFIWKNPWMVAASNTFINYMLDEAGYINIYNEESRYPEVELDDPKLQEADSIFLSSEPYPFKEKHILELQSLLPNKQIVIVDGELFSWYGSRLLQSYKYFESLSYLE